jgi:hypothetical protein
MTIILKEEEEEEERTTQKPMVLHQFFHNSQVLSVFETTRTSGSSILIFSLKTPEPAVL